VAADNVPFSVSARTPTGSFILSGELDLATRDVLADALTRAVGEGGPTTLDFSSVTFMDAAGMGSLLDALKATDDGCIILHGVRGIVAKVIHITGLGQMERIHVLECTQLAA
jgi:anti-anti-sigma factor